MQSTRERQQLLEACQRRGCLLCRLGQESAEHYLDAWKYELFTDVGVREELRRSRGFCHRHTWQLAQMGATIQLAVAYRDILSDAAEQLEGGSRSAHRRSWFEAKRVPCPGCMQEEQAVVSMIPFLRQALLDNEFYTAFLASDGLCLAHYQRACELKVSGGSEHGREWLTQLRQGQLAILQRLDAQLGELIRKHDYRFKGEAKGEEMLSWRWAAGIVAGEDKHIDL